MRAVLRPCGSERRWNADQTRRRGGYSGGGCPSPSGQESFCSRATLLDVAKGGRNVADDTPATHWLMHATDTHLPQSNGAGALAGQHGMSPAIPSIAMGAEVSSVTIAIESSGNAPAISCRDNGAMTIPAIRKIASSRRMVICECTPQNRTGAPHLKAPLVTRP
jgi:hypothetical protein